MKKPKKFIWEHNHKDLGKMTSYVYDAEEMDKYIFILVQQLKENE